MIKLIHLFPIGDFEHSASSVSLMLISLYYRKQDATLAPFIIDLVGAETAWSADLHYPLDSIVNANSVPVYHIVILILCIAVQTDNLQNIISR